MALRRTVYKINIQGLDNFEVEDISRMVMELKGIPTYKQGNLEIKHENQRRLEFIVYELNKKHNKQGFEITSEIENSCIYGS